jgi:hypothetical protein
MSDTLEAVRAALLAEARRRFGPARAEALAAELGGLAEDVVRVNEFQLGPGDEPGFYLRDE